LHHRKVFLLLFKKSLFMQIQAFVFIIDDCFSFFQNIGAYNTFYRFYVVLFKGGIYMT